MQQSTGELRKPLACAISLHMALLDLTSDNELELDDSSSDSSPVPYATCKEK